MWMGENAVTLLLYIYYCILKKSPIFVECRTLLLYTIYNTIQLNCIDLRRRNLLLLRQRDRHRRRLEKNGSLKSRVEQMTF